MQPQIYSFGYAKSKPDDLVTLSAQLGAVVIDVRAKPGGKPGFRKNQLQSKLGERYQWRGDILPGFGADTLTGRIWLETFDRPSILLCAEHNPVECHRHQTIALPLYLSPVNGAAPRIVLHYFEEHLVRADDLQSCITVDDFSQCPMIGLSTYLGQPSAARHLYAVPKEVNRRNPGSGGATTSLGPSRRYEPNPGGFQRNTVDAYAYRIRVASIRPIP